MLDAVALDLITLAVQHVVLVLSDTFSSLQEAFIGVNVNKQRCRGTGLLAHNLQERAGHMVLCRRGQLAFAALDTVALDTLAVAFQRMTPAIRV